MGPPPEGGFFQITRASIFPLEVLHGMLLTWFDCYSCEHEGWERTFAAQGLLQC